MDKHPQPRGRLTEPKVVATAMTVGLGALAGLAAYSMLVPAQDRHRGERAQRHADDAPGRSAKKARFGDMAVTGRSVTINRAKDEVFAFCRDFANLPRYMENIEAVTEGEGTQSWTIRAPLGRSVKVVTRIVNEREGEQFAWRTTDESQIEGEGKIMLRDAPGGRGTIVTSIVAYKPPLGAVGQAVAKLFQAEPQVQTRRDLKRLKMLLETGEVATNVNQRSEGQKAQDAAREEA
jgi:uncharacterized membrane protein